MILGLIKRIYKGLKMVPTLRMFYLVQVRSEQVSTFQFCVVILSCKFGKN